MKTLLLGLGAVLAILIGIVLVRTVALGKAQMHSGNAAQTRAISPATPTTSTASPPTYSTQPT